MAKTRPHLWTGPERPIGLRAPVKCCDRGYLSAVHAPTWGRRSEDPFGDDRARFAKAAATTQEAPTWPGTLCESGWTGDRCQLPLHHDGPHDNEDDPRAAKGSASLCPRCGMPELRDSRCSACGWADAVALGWYADERRPDPCAEA